MPRSFELSLESPASVGQVLAAFRSEDYWLDRLASMTGGVRTLESLEVDPDGAVRVVNTEDLSRGALPALIARAYRVYRGDLSVVTTETWTPSPAGDGRVDGAVTVAVTGAPGSGHGTGVLTPSAESAGGSRLTLAATVHFNVPLIGGTIESQLARQLRDALVGVQAFTTTWIGDHA